MGKAPTVTYKIGCGPLLAISIGLLVLKFTMAPELSWWIVTLPLWVFPAIFVGFWVLMLAMLAAVAIGAGIVAACNWVLSK